MRGEGGSHESRRGINQIFLSILLTAKVPPHPQPETRAEAEVGSSPFERNPRVERKPMRSPPTPGSARRERERETLVAS